MKPKHYQLIEILSFEKNKYILATEIAKALHVTDRTIRNYVREINEDPATNYQIISSSNGYKLMYSNEIDTNKDQISLIYRSEEEYKILEFKILKFLINASDYKTYDEISTTFFYSPQVIRSRIQKLAQVIKKMTIEVGIEAQIFKGIKLSGTEIQKRMLLELFYNRIVIEKRLFKETTIQFFDDWLSKDEIVFLFNLVDELNEQFKLNLDFLIYKKMITQLIISFYQIRQGYFVKTDEAQIEKIGILKEFEIAESIYVQFSKKIQIPRKEIIFFTDYLVSLQLNLGEIPSRYKDTIVVDKIVRVLKEIEQINSIDVYSNEVFRKNLINHIYRIISPASNNMSIYNPYIREAKSEYLYSFSIAANIASKIDDYFSIKIYDDEIAYLTYHIQLILDARKKVKIPVVILYNRNYSRTKVLSMKLLTYFDEVEIERIEKYSTLKKLDNTTIYIGIDLVETMDTTEKLINISYQFDSDDIKKITLFLASQNYILTNASVYWLSERNPKKIIEKLLKLENRSYLLDPVLKREEMSATSIGNLVAFPHPYLSDKKHNEQLIIGILENAITWGNEQVQLILLVIPSQDIERNEFIFHEFYQKTKSLEKVMRLIESKTKDEFVQKWNEI